MPLSLLLPVFLLAGLGALLVNSAILLSSLPCAATIPAWLWLLRHLGVQP